MGMKSKKKLLLSATCLFFIFLTACGVKTYDVTTLEFEKTGKITYHIVEDWDSEIYNFDEFVAYNEKEVNDYNAANQSVTILSSELVDGKAKVVIQYSDDDAYYDLNKKSLYYGRADKAKGVGYSLVNLVKSVENGKTLTQAQWNEMTSEQVIVLSESMNVVAPSKIIYIGSGVELTGENTATVTMEEGFAYIICK